MIGAILDQIDWVCMALPEFHCVYSGFHRKHLFGIMQADPQGWEEGIMTKTIEAVFDGENLRPDEPLELAPNTRVRVTIETPSPSEAPQSFLRTARALCLSGPSDWSANLETYLYGDR